VKSIACSTRSERRGPKTLTPAFTHCALQVSDLNASIAFYARYCGMEIVKEHGDGASRVVWLASPGAEKTFVLVLLGGGQVREQDVDDMTHYGFGVASREEIDRIAAQAKEDGLLHWVPRDYAPPTGYLCGVKDPTGYIIEFSCGQPLGPHAKDG
jgi:catechol 2,3-dioxygenase-like lactoylglutathione lyase family enzyme